MFNLTDPVWGGIDAIVGMISLIVSVLSLIVSVWLAQNPSIRGKLARNSWRGIAIILSLLLPIYSIFALPIITVNAITDDARTVLYSSVGIASILGVIWGVIWATYIWKAFTTTGSRRQSGKTKSI